MIVRLAAFSMPSRRRGQADNTIVIYTSDHGENKGDHGMWWKNCAFEASARIPLIVSWPGHLPEGERRTGACSLVDVVQTCCDYAQADAPETWDGTSLQPLLQDDATEWKDQAVSMYYAHNVSSGWAMIRQGEWKYVYHSHCDDQHPAESELYNLAEDPQEFTNLAHDPTQADRIAAMHQDLVAELQEEPDAIERRYRQERSQPYEREFAT